MRVPKATSLLWNRWARATQRLSPKLVILLLTAMTIVFGLLGYLNVRLQRQHLESITLTSAERVSDVIKRQASYYMLRNEREGLYHSISEIGNEPGVVHIRIFNREGRITYSSDPKEINTLVDEQAEACNRCHAQAQPLTHLDRPDRFRTFRLASGERVLGIINPIENSPECSNADCHAHTPEQRVLGVLDTDLSLAAADAGLAQANRQTLRYTLLAVLAISCLTAAFIWRFVQKPLKALEEGAARLGSGELGYQVDIRSRDELADVAAAFNRMSQHLKDAREELNGWNQTLAARVEQKTKELNRVYEQMLSVEKMASIGRLAAVVAHEINNPLTGILTYAKLLKRRLVRADSAEQKELLSSIEMIESESRRCGEIVKDLLTFGRTTTISYEPTDLNRVIDHCVRLVRHKLDLAGVHLDVELAQDLPMIRCDPSQIEQVMLALVVNAVDAMPNGGNLKLRTLRKPHSGEVAIEVEDDGGGIPKDVLPHLFEPFFTTKEREHGLGLGLAISLSIVERHQGRIEVKSELGRGTKFTVTLPVEGVPIPRSDAPLSTVRG
ncbi:MAG TPA: ATP-binding protein [Methylomirabilota bacterium]|nr:ATP-binding protein [Methylomirabilota bacterium]